jgi:hypothetical protein
VRDEIVDPPVELVLANGVREIGAARHDHDAPASYFPKLREPFAQRRVVTQASPDFHHPHDMSPALSCT